MDLLCVPIVESEENLNDSSSDEELEYGYRKMTTEEVIKYNKQVKESDGFDVYPLPAKCVYGCCGGLIQPGIVHADGPKDVYEIARFAINHINNAEGTKLKLDRIIKYNEQLCCSPQYRLYITFTATDINTGGTYVYQTKVTDSLNIEQRSVDIFRRIYHQQFGKEDEIRFLTIFAINYHYRTTGQDLELVKGIAYEQFDDRCIITFKARDLSSCMVEIYQMEVVSRDPIENSTVNYLTKNPDPSTYEDLAPVVNNASESKVASIIQAYVGRSFDHASEYAKMSGQSECVASCNEYEGSISVYSKEQDQKQ